MCTYMGLSPSTFQPLPFTSRLCPASQVIECLLKAKAFIVKNLGTPSEDAACGAHGGKGQYTWSRYDSVSAAWEAAKNGAFWPCE